MADKRPLVSIVVPVRNGELFLDETLASALTQSYRDIEVIVVDDGSTDGTQAIVAAWTARDSRVRAFAQANQGVAAARNRAIAEARGEFIAPLDADDVWDPTKIERQLSRMEAAGDDVGLVYCWWLVVDDTGAVLDSSPRWTVEGRAADALVHVNFTGNASVPLYRRRVLERVGGYDATLRERGAEGCEDLDVALKVAELSRVAVVRSYLVGYRRHVGTMSNETRRMFRSYSAVLMAVRSRRADVPRSYVNGARDQLALYLAGVSWWAGDHTSAVGWAVRALRSQVTYGVLIYVIRMLWNRATRSGSPVLAIRAGERFSELPIPEPLIPYDRLYRQRFQSLAAE